MIVRKNIVSQAKIITQPRRKASRRKNIFAVDCGATRICGAWNVECGFGDDGDVVGFVDSEDDFAMLEMISC